MTREQKLALIIGFSVFMVVGVLVGDYFSKARSARLDPGLAGNMLVQEPDPRPAGGTVVLPVVHRPGNPAPVDPLHESGGMVPREGLEGSGPAVQIDPDRVTPPAPTPPAPATPEVPSKTYTIKKGDSLGKIAKTEYGDESLWKKLGEFNKDTLKGGINLSEGKTLKLPEKEFLTGKPAKPPAPSNTPTTPSREGAKTGAGTTPSPANTPARDAGSKKIETARTYTVKPGDTLRKIAASTLGSAGRFEEIRELNKMSDDSVRVGAVIKLPAK